jgi:transposase, IS6 family
MDETFVRIAGRWLYLFRAVDSQGQARRDREAAKRFLRKALSNLDNLAPYVFTRGRIRSYPAAIRELENERVYASTLSASTRRYATTGSLSGA